jgi:hypothetical protein
MRGLSCRVGAFAWEETGSDRGLAGAITSDPGQLEMRPRSRSWPCRAITDERPARSKGRRGACGAFTCVRAERGTGHPAQLHVYARAAGELISTLPAQLEMTAPRAFASVQHRVREHPVADALTRFGLAGAFTDERTARALDPSGAITCDPEQLEMRAPGPSEARSWPCRRS